MHSIAEKDIAHHLGRPAELCFVHDSLIAHEHPLITVQAFNADPVRRENDSPDHFLVRLTITGNHFGPTQIANNVLLCRLKGLMAALEHIGQSTLAQLQPKHLIKHPGKPDKRYGLKALQVENQGVQSGPKRRASGGRWQRALHTSLAARTANAHATVAAHKRRYRRQVDLVVFADDIAL